MKRKISLLLAVLFVMLSLTACGKYKCPLCLKEKSGRRYPIILLGEDVDICPDCYSFLRSMLHGS